ncbi:hypothetical protein KDK_75680 [Dictyobacter kobayashii]|uniref:Uncharacterized protein n=1 Tax=Dictyobacter kobayashii TaxID=2014872 RepID=A0A402AXF1_9CHLR|nr:hypothetical protein KDK_75680 [Dictyobacter kobayashii]
MQVVRVTHIQAAELTDQHFTRPAEFDLPSYWTEYVSLTNHFPAHGRGNQSQKKAKMKAALSTRIPAQRGNYTARNKKKHFYLQYACAGFVSGPLTLPQKGLEPLAPIMTVA